MKKYFKPIRLILLSLAFLFVGVSCSDTWDDHYSTKNSIVNNENSIASYISGIDEVSKFVDALKTTKMLKINDKPQSVSFYEFLSSDQFVTVWVPSNSAMTEAEWEIFTKPNKTEAENLYVAKQLLLNHIARYNHSLSDGNDTLDVLMMNNKHHFAVSKSSIDNSGYKMDGNGKPMVNISCSNGIVHFLSDDEYLDYMPTIYEFLTTDPDYSLLIGNLLKKYTQLYLDENASVPSGFNDEGNMVYIDSVTTKVNLLLKGGLTDFYYSGLGLIDDEDSSYTMVLPSVEAWNAQFASMQSNFDFGIQDTPNDSLQNFWSNIAMISDAIFSNTLQRSPKDSVCSTLYSFLSYKDKDNINYHRFLNPYDKNTGLFYRDFNDLDSVMCSNGKIYITKNWNFDKYSTYLPTIVEDCYTKSDVVTYIVPKYEIVTEVDEYGDPKKDDNGNVITTTKEGASFTEVRNRNISDGYVLRISSAGKYDVWSPWKFSYMIHNVMAGKYLVKFVVTYEEDDKDPKPINIHPSVYFYYNSDPFNRQYESTKDPKNKEMLIDEINKKKQKIVYRSKTRDDNGNLKLSDTIVMNTFVVVPNCTYKMEYASLQVNIENVKPAASDMDNLSPFVFLDKIILEPVKE